MLLITALAGTLLINSVACLFPMSDKYTPVISVQSPKNQIYNENSVLAEFSVSLYSWEDYTVQLVIEYSLDGSTWMPLVGVQQSFVQQSSSEGLANCRSTLRSLSEGSHSLKIQVTAFYTAATGDQMRTPPGVSDTIFFTVNAAEPRVRVLSPMTTKTYNTTTLPLDFAVSEPVDWVGYSLDGEDNVTITGNTTLTGLSDGKHTLRVYAEDTTGSTGASTPSTFYVETQTNSQTPTHPTEPQTASLLLLLVVAAVIASLVSTSIVVYFKKRKH